MSLLDLLDTSKKLKKKWVLEENKIKGKLAEDIVKTRYFLSGYEVERTGRGHDFRVRKRDIFTGRVIESKLIEVKSGSAELSELQHKMKKRKSNYKVERVSSFF